MVRNVFGERLVVASQLGCQVIVERKTDWYHPTKLIPYSTKQSTEGQAKA